MQRTTTKTVMVSLRQIQETAEKELLNKKIENPIKAKTNEDIEDESISQFNEAISLVLPRPLTREQDPVHQELLNLSPDPEKIKQYRFEICRINSGLLDSTNDLLMMDPVRKSSVKNRQVIEREECISKMSFLRSADEVSQEIQDLLDRNRKYEDIQYLPNDLKRQMTAACLSGDTEAIHHLYKKNRRLLWTPDPDSKKSPLHSAILNEKSLEVVI
ncbi:MAG TPA: hypothetical protein VGQ59_06200, partial [Cyclobacteriaceae bacterium]|nr:hypothetical protein [Cyclobacteriaceae bacterium]